MKVILLLFFTAFVLTDADAQLNRKAQLGALLDYVTENGISGCKVKKVKTGTSVALKLRENDLITKIGDSLFESKEQFIRQFLQYAPETTIRLTVVRGNEVLTLKAKAVA
jgi:S1-C subfamily serine protease